MPRRSIPTFLFIAILAVAANASDFWLSKDWKQWSKDECARMLTDSPWAHTWRGGAPTGDQLVYTVQFRSAPTVRQALVRELQFDQKYDKMNDSQRSAFDAQAAQMLNRDYAEVILVHVDFSKGTAAAFLQGNLNSHSVTIDTWSASLVTEDGTRIAPIRFDTKKNYTFDVIFPRTKDGAPLIKDGQKHFSFQFQSPLLTEVSSVGVGSPTVAARRIGVEFDLAKMATDGKASY